MQGDGGETERILGEDVLGGYIESALGILIYVVIAVVVIAVIAFLAIRLIRKERERRLPGRERVKLEYGRLQKAAIKKNREFQSLSTLREQIAWMRENCRVEISDAQEEALYEVFFAEDIKCDCDQLCRKLRSCRAK